MKSQKVTVRELLAPLIISQSGKTGPRAGGGVGIDLAYVLALMGKRKKKKKKLDMAKILKMLWSLRMVRKLDSLQGAV